MGWDSGCDHAKHQISSSALVMLQREIPPEINQQAAELAAAANVPVMLDVGGDPTPLPEELSTLMSVVAPNETELAMLTQMPTDTDDQISNAARSLQRSGVDEVLVTVGSRGSFLFDSDGSTVFHQPSFNVDNVVDTTGAGDCFRAAYAVARYVDQMPPKPSLEFGAAAAALLVQRKGAMKPPTRQETQEFIKANVN